MGQICIEIELNIGFVREASMRGWKTNNWVRHQIARDERGGIAVMFALAFPVIFMVAGGALDYAIVMRHQQNLQNASDSASMAAARELTLIDYTKIDANGMATNVVTSMMSSNVHSLLEAGAVSVSASIMTDPLRVTVNATQPVRSIFGPLRPQCRPSVSHFCRAGQRPPECLRSGPRSIENGNRISREIRPDDWPKLRRLLELDAFQRHHGQE